MGVADLGTHFVVIAGLPGLGVMRLEVLSVAKERVCVTNVVLAESAAANCFANLFRCIESTFTEAPDQLWPEPPDVASDGKITLNFSNHQDSFR